MNVRQIGLVAIGMVFTAIVSSICTKHIVGSKTEKILRSDEELWERFIEACPNAK